MTARWIVDAMNVIGSRPDGWWKDRHGAMVALVDRLEHWASAHGGEDAGAPQVTVVLERPPSKAIRSSLVQIAHAPKAAANSADDEIVRLVTELLQAETSPRDIRVVTSDKTLADRVRTMGASVHRAEAFRNLIDPRGNRAGDNHGD